MLFVTLEISNLLERPKFIHQNNMDNVLNKFIRTQRKSFDNTPPLITTFKRIIYSNVPNLFIEMIWIVFQDNSLN